LSAVLRALTRNRAATDPASPDRRLRGRTYAIPFEAVWRAAVGLAQGGIRGWSFVEADDEEGLIRAESKTLLFRFVDDVVVNVGLDENGQTRVDLESASRVGRGDLGRNARSIATFFKRLDRVLQASPAQILDPTRSPSWTPGS
jgi:Protein of unknown function (DUF1499)